MLKKRGHGLFLRMSGRISYRQAKIIIIRDWIYRTKENLSLGSHRRTYSSEAS
jgi:hypothetical protein